MTALHRALAGPTASSAGPGGLARPDDRNLLPWSADQLILVLAVDAAGLGMIFVSWYLISGETGLAHQMAWLKLGISGLGLAAIGNGMWLLNGRRTIGLARASLLEPLAAAARSGTKEHRRMPAGEDPFRDASRDLVYTAATMIRYHRHGCALTQGKPLVPSRRDDALDSGRIACETCEP